MFQKRGTQFQCGFTNLYNNKRKYQVSFKIQNNGFRKKTKNKNLNFLTDINFKMSLNTDCSSIKSIKSL